jgi:EKC/KEOPS complex subunit PCC1/LAGE3
MVLRSLDVPFPTSRLATTALQALQVDPELSPLVRRQFSVIGAPGDQSDIQLLRVEYQAATNRMLRVSFNSFMDSLKLVLEVMEQLDEDVLAAENGGQA